MSLQTTLTLHQGEARHTHAARDHTDATHSCRQKPRLRYSLRRNHAKRKLGGKMVTDIVMSQSVETTLTLQGPTGQTHGDHTDALGGDGNPPWGRRLSTARRTILRRTTLRRTMCKVRHYVDAAGRRTTGRRLLQPPDFPSPHPSPTGVSAGRRQRSLLKPGTGASAAR